MLTTHLMQEEDRTLDEITIKQGSHLVEANNSLAFWWNIVRIQGGTLIITITNGPPREEL